MTKVGGFINETHAEEIEQVFGSKIAGRVAEANEGTFLSILFADFSKGESE